MRNLNNKDLFKVMKIVRKAKVKDKILKLDLPKDKDGNIAISENEYGVILIMEFIDGAPDAEKEIFELLAEVGEVEVKELEEDEFDLLPDIIKHLSKQEKLVNFLKQALGSAN